MKKENKLNNIVPDDTSYNSHSDDSINSGFETDISNKQWLEDDPHDDEYVDDKNLDSDGEFGYPSGGI